MNAPSLGHGLLVLGTFAVLSRGWDPGRKVRRWSTKTWVRSSAGCRRRETGHGHLRRRRRHRARPPAGAQGLQKIQRDVSDLLVAKSTFVALVDDKGIAIRNNLEPDAMAGKDLFSLFPALKTADAAPRHHRRTVPGRHRTAPGPHLGGRLPSEKGRRQDHRLLRHRLVVPRLCPSSGELPCGPEGAQAAGGWRYWQPRDPSRPRCSMRMAWGREVVVQTRRRSPRRRSPPEARRHRQAGPWRTAW